MARFTVRIGGVDKTFTSAENMRRYIMRYGDKIKRYTYHGEGGAFMDRYGEIYCTKTEGWKVKLKSGDIYPVDRRTGAIFKGGRFTVRVAKKGESIPSISSYDDRTEAINGAISKYARNRGAKVYVFDGDKKLGRIGEEGGYATWIDYKRKSVSSFRETYTVPTRPPAPKQPGWIIAGRPRGSKGAYKYYSGETFATKKYAMVWPYNKYSKAEETIGELRYYGAYENYEFKIMRE